MGEKRIPLIRYVQAGVWTDVVDNYAPGDADEFLLTDLELSGNAFALEIKGDSMLTEFKPGDRVIIDPAVAPQPGDFVVAKNGEDEATFKKYRPRSVNERGDVVFELVPMRTIRQCGQMWLQYASLGQWWNTGSTGIETECTEPVTAHPCLV
jgi:hypothetical protein